MQDPQERVEQTWRVDAAALGIREYLGQRRKVASEHDQRIACQRQSSLYSTRLSNTRKYGIYRRVQGRDTGADGLLRLALGLEARLCLAHPTWTPAWWDVHTIPTWRGFRVQ